MMYLDYPWYCFASSLTASLGLAFWGWKTLRRHGPGVGALVLWLLAGAFGPLFGPDYLVDEVRIDSAKIEWTSGYWWDKYTNTIRFADIAAVVVKERTFRSGSRIVWELHERSGENRDVVVSKLWARYNDQIEAQFRRRGVPVQSRPRLS